jgi:uncharacterized protein YcfL
MRILGIIAILSMLALAGCTSKKTLVVEETTKVAMPPVSLWVCPKRAMPASFDSQADVADYVLSLYESYQICKDSLEDVRAWLIEAEKIAEGSK